MLGLVTTLASKLTTIVTTIVAQNALKAKIIKRHTWTTLITMRLSR